MKCLWIELHQYLLISSIFWAELPHYTFDDQRNSVPLELKIYSLLCWCCDWSCYGDDAPPHVPKSLKLFFFSTKAWDRQHYASLKCLVEFLILWKVLLENLFCNKIHLLFLPFLSKAIIKNWLTISNFIEYFIYQMVF